MTPSSPPRTSRPTRELNAQNAVDPAVFIVFGSTGDLARRKILPALYQLHCQGFTSNGCVILGVTRETIDDAKMREIAKAAVKEHDVNDKDVDEWADKFIFFQSIKDGAKEDFQNLKQRIEQLEAQFKYPQNRTFYISLPPVAFAPTVKGLGEGGLNKSSGYTRVVIEKPFGRDLASAKALNAVVHEYFDESQIYRIDHYLGKETVQNLLVFRFANAMFETLWNRDHIDSVSITVAEELGVEQRAAYYETAGATRDMIQSHLTQLLSVVAMEVPAAMEADSIRGEKIKALKSVAPIDLDNVVFGQYERGEIDGQSVPGYREEPGVAPTSNTETFVALELKIENWRWQGVPFFLRTGKRLPKRVTEIEVRFRKAPVWMFRTIDAGELRSNTLLLTLQPNEGFSLFFDVKAPGDPFRMQRLPLHFEYSEAFKALPEAYQTLILDVLSGDQTLFVHADEVEQSWTIYAPLLDGRRAVWPYAAGSWGPKQADRLKAAR
jgi:glucose-6-phosphate 1-dehydrogenase